MGAQINLFYKFTRKPEIGVEEVFVGWSSLDDLVGGGPYFAPGPDEVGGGASKGYRGAGKTPRCRYLAKARLALLRSGPRRGRGWSFEGLVYRLELDVEWVGEE